MKVEVGYGLGRDNVNSRPADVLVQGWDCIDVTVTSSITPVTLSEASVAGAFVLPTMQELRRLVIF